MSTSNYISKIKKKSWRHSLGIQHVLFCQANDFFDIQLNINVLTTFSLFSHRVNIHRNDSFIVLKSIHKPTLWKKSAFLGNFMYNTNGKHIKSLKCQTTQNKTN